LMVIDSPKVGLRALAAARVVTICNPDFQCLMVCVSYL
jgi:hypothetical protein